MRKRKGEEKVGRKGKHELAKQHDLLCHFRYIVLSFLSEIIIQLFSKKVLNTCYISGIVRDTWDPTAIQRDSDAPPSSLAF